MQSRGTQGPSKSKGGFEFNIEEIDFGDFDEELEELELTKEEIELGEGVKKFDYPCVPERTRKKECAFSNDLLLLPEYARKKGKFPFISTPTDPFEAREFLDYLDEFSVYVIKKGTTLIHAAHNDRLQKVGMTKDGKLKGFLNTKCWWSEFLPGAGSYGGGWFTYGSSYGGPDFGLYLYYELLKDIPVLYIPDYTRRIDDPEYIKRTKHVEDNIDTYSGSHIVQGPRDWNKKGYQNLHEKDNYFADGLAKRLSELGFNGYISCDECEVFISHEAMLEGAITYPYRIDYNGDFETTTKQHQSILNFITNYCAGQRKVPLQVSIVKTRDEARQKIIFERNLEYEQLLRENFQNT